ncbi:glutathione S-transferase T3-like [Spinacia oleracea]|uniref:Glutathione S-transferase T3-like n=1 Tax=Spinacia oleracea TaxID=3562 RepID=A0A9R0JBZ7_SPIOL|nr:glutathione S-transferase T3-like [Spinacia oleracea]
MSEGENVLPNFNNSHRETAVSEDDNDDDDVDNDDDDAENEGGANSSSRRFWSHAEDEVLVKASLEVGCNKKTNTKQKGAVFWGKIVKMFDNVRLYKEKLYNEGAEGVTKSDLLKVRNLEQLRNRWKRIAASCAKFSGAYASAVEWRESGWELVENIVDTCKKNTSNQGNNSKRSRINEAGNYSSSTNPDTLTSGDIGCFGFPLSDGSSKNKGKNKVMNVPSESFQQWLDVVQNMNITRQSETEMERERLKYEREREVEKVQLEREKEA